MFHSTRFEDTPFFPALKAALEACMRTHPERKMTFGEWHSALHADGQNRLKDGRERYTPGQVKSGLIWLANHREGFFMSLEDRKNYFWAEAQETEDAKEAPTPATANH